MALRNQKELGFSAQQVSSLQQLGLDSRGVTIRRRADAQLAQLDFFGVLRAEPVDMGKVEAKVRAIERFKADGSSPASAPTKRPRRSSRPSRGRS